MGAEQEDVRLLKLSTNYCVTHSTRCGGQRGNGYLSGFKRQWSKTTGLVCYEVCEQTTYSPHHATDRGAKGDLDGFTLYVPTTRSSDVMAMYRKWVAPRNEQTSAAVSAASQPGTPTHTEMGMYRGAHRSQVGHLAPYLLGRPLSLRLRQCPRTSACYPLGSIGKSGVKICLVSAASMQAL